jgi:hypothetical protein
MYVFIYRLHFIGDLDFPAVNQPITVTKGFNEKIA